MSNLSSLDVQTLEFSRLEFPIGWGETGAVFLRVRVYPDGTLSFFCSKALDGGKTNLTSSFERIFEAAVRVLAEQGLVALPTLEDGPIPRSVLAAIAHRSVWVEHTRPEDHLQGLESFALVHTDSALNPCWIYLSKKTLAQQSGLDETFLTLPVDQIPPSTLDDLEAVALSHLDQIYDSLKTSSLLLQQGKSLGIHIGLSATAKERIASRHGPDALVVLENCATLP